MVKPIEFYPITFEVLIKIFKSKNEFESQKCGECRLTLTWSVYRLYCIVHISIIYLFQYISFSIYISVYISSLYIYIFSIYISVYIYFRSYKLFISSIANRCFKQGFHSSCCFNERYWLVSNIWIWWKGFWAKQYSTIC